MYLDINQSNFNYTPSKWPLPEPEIQALVISHVPLQPPPPRTPALAPTVPGPLHPDPLLVQHIHLYIFLCKTAWRSRLKQTQADNKPSIKICWDNEQNVSSRVLKKVVLIFMSTKSVFKETDFRLPWWSSSKEPTCQCRGQGSNLWSRKIPHAVGN